MARSLPVRLALMLVAAASVVTVSLPGQSRGQQPAARGAPPPQNPASVEIHSLHVQGSVWMLVGGGGNVAVQVGDEGVLLVDT